MAEVKLTKNELRDQQVKLAQLQKYLPTLQLKKAMLQAEVNDARAEIHTLEKSFEEAKARVEGFSELLSESTGVDFGQASTVDKVVTDVENIAGVDVPVYQSVEFAPISYSLFETPPWVDLVVSKCRKMVEGQVKVEVAEEKKVALEKELREVSIRVNLFEKILIPRTVKNISKIKVFLGDQQLAAVAQAKVAKTKIERKKTTAKKKSIAGLVSPYQIS